MPVLFPLGQVQPLALLTVGVGLAQGVVNGATLRRTSAVERPAA